MMFNFCLTNRGKKRVGRTPKARNAGGISTLFKSPKFNLKDVVAP